LADLGCSWYFTEIWAAVDLVTEFLRFGITWAFSSVMWLCLTVINARHLDYVGGWSGPTPRDYFLSAILTLAIVGVEMFILVLVWGLVERRIAPGTRVREKVLEWWIYCVGPSAWTVNVVFWVLSVA
jgi:hypothetical protein